MQSIPISSVSAVGNKPWYKHRWPWFLMLGPFLVIVAGSFTGWLAFSRPDALVVGDYYKQGKAINQDLRRDRMAAKLGLHFNMRFDPAGGRLTGQIDGLSGPQTGKIFIQLLHSTLPQKDIKLVVDTDENGMFSASLPMLETSRWQVLVENEKRDWKLDGIWSWPQQLSMRISADPVPAE